MKLNNHILICFGLLFTSVSCNILGTEYGPRTVTIVGPLYQNHNPAHHKDKGHTEISMTASITKIEPKKS